MARTPPIKLTESKPTGGKPNLSASSFDALLGAQFEKITEVSPTEIPLSQIRFVEQPRKHFDPVQLEQLSASIREHGVLQPVLVRHDGLNFLLIAGERRCRAAKLAGLSEVPARVLHISETQARTVATVENLNRTDLNPLEETEAVLSLLENRYHEDRSKVLERLRKRRDLERGRSGHNVMSSEEAFELDAFFSALGRFAAGSFFVNRVPLLKMPDTLKAAVLGGRLEYTKASLLAKIVDEEKREALLERTLKESLSLSQIRALLSNSKQESGVLEKFKTSLEKPLSRLEPKQRKRAEKLLEELHLLLEG